MIRCREVRLALSSPTAREVAEVRGWLAAVSERARAIEVVGASLLLVSPLGLADRSLLAQSLAALGVPVRHRLPLQGWARITTALRLPEREQTAARLRRAPLFERAWRAVFPRDLGEAWAIDAADHRRVERLKRTMRAPLGHVRVDFGIPGEKPRLLSPFHLADAAEAEEEAARVLGAAAITVGEAGPGRIEWSAPLRGTGGAVATP
jgi:hypothetical protein